MQPAPAAYGIHTFCLLVCEASDSLRHFPSVGALWGGRLESLVILGMLVGQRWAAR